LSSFNLFKQKLGEKKKKSIGVSSFLSKS